MQYVSVVLSAVGAMALIAAFWAAVVLLAERLKRRQKARQPDLGPAIDDLANDRRFQEIRDRIGKVQALIGEQTNVIADQAGGVATLLKQLSEQLAGGQKRQDQTLGDIQTGIDVLASTMVRFNKNFEAWQKSMFGASAVGYEEVDADAEAVKEQAEKLVRRYGIPWEEARDRAKKMLVYSPDSPMRAQV